MKNLKNIVTLLSLLFALVALAAPSFAAPDKSDKASGKDNCCIAMKPDHKSSCASCQKTCEETLKYFQKKGGKYAEAKHIQTLKDCIALCRTSADFQARGSANASKVESLCHDICLQCAQMCKDMNDPKLADCVKSCEECASCCDKG